MDMYDLDIPWKDRWRKRMRLTTELKKFAKENYFDATNPMCPAWHLPQDQDSVIEYSFRDVDACNNMRTSCDSQFNRGNSTCQFSQSSNGTAMFSGNLDYTVPDRGDTYKTGYAAFRTPVKYKAFRIRYEYIHWRYFSHFIMKIRGDGRTYHMCINSDFFFDATEGDMWMCPVFTHGGPYWQVVAIPFSKFYKTTHNRIQDTQYSAECRNNCYSFGFTICDRINGPFQVEIDWMGVYLDHKHFEEYKYEEYYSPSM